MWSSEKLKWVITHRSWKRPGGALPRPVFPFFSPFRIFGFFCHFPAEISNFSAFSHFRAFFVDFVLFREGLLFSA